jgi:hypothetical protein
VNIDPSSSTSPVMLEWKPAFDLKPVALGVPLKVCVPIGVQPSDPPLSWVASANSFSCSAGGAF